MEITLTVQFTGNFFLAEGPLHWIETIMYPPKPSEQNHDFFDIYELNALQLSRFVNAIDIYTIIKSNAYKYAYKKIEESTALRSIIKKVQKNRITDFERYNSNVFNTYI